MNEIVGFMLNLHGGSGAPDTTPDVAKAGAAVAVDGDAVRGALLAVVAAKTGYPAEMLDLGMDVEADLGIDSIKRVEIM
ncbi:phosphopantetheine-binding protein, partial [Streptomyces sp. ADMS]|uniref:phosphopantetheine-binding protein n=1 Tax=Streptomyces sp. ADMS TaxID=3071415 RepID=UPI00296F65C8